MHQRWCAPGSLPSGGADDVERYGVVPVRPVRALGAAAELAIVLAGAAALVLGSVLAPSPADAAGLQALIAATVAGFLWLRGWTPSCLGLRPTLAATLEGGIVAFSVLAVSAALHFAVARTWPDLAVGTWPLAIAGEAPSLLQAVAIFALVPIVEEVLVTGYLMSRVASVGGMALALNASVALRLATYAPHGTAALVLALPLGLLFASWYAGTRRLWPLIVAHVLIAWLLLTS